MKEFNLSEKICEGILGNSLSVSDVKEFIRLLNKEFDLCIEASPDTPGNPLLEQIKKGTINMLNLVRNKINKHAGEELTK